MQPHAVGNEGNERKGILEGGPIASSMQKSLEGQMAQRGRPALATPYTFASLAAHVAPYTFASLAAHSGNLEVAYLALEPGNAARHADDLRAFGFTVSVYPSVTAACASLPPDTAILITLQAEGVNVHLAVAQLRLAFPRAGIIVIADALDRLSRVGAMLSGADACVEAMPESLELMAALLASKRRMQAEDVPQKNDAVPHAMAQANRSQSDGTAEAALRPASAIQWHLENNDRILVAPNGARMELNGSERKIMVQFLSSPKDPLTRIGQGASYDPHSGKITRGLDVAISRLRRKAAAHAIHLPIRSIRGQGYVFAGDEAERP